MGISIAEERRKEVLTYLYDRRNIPQPSMSIQEISDRLHDNGIGISTKQVARILDSMLIEGESPNTEPEEPDHTPKYPGLVKMDRNITRTQNFEDQYQRWYWDKAYMLSFDIPMDLTTALTFKLVENMIGKTIPNIAEVNLKQYIHHANKYLNRHGSDISPLNEKIRTITPSQEDFLPKYDDEDAANTIFYSLAKNTPFKADYSRSAYDMNLQYGKWDEKGILRGDCTPYRGYIFHPIGLIARGSVYFIIAYVTPPKEKGPPSWKPTRFALHKFSHAEALKKEDYHITQNFDLDWYVKHDLMESVINKEDHVPDEINLKIAVSAAVAEFLVESPAYGLQMVAVPTRRILRQRRETRRVNLNINLKLNYVFSGKTKDTWQLRRWLLSLKDIKVLEPDPLKNFFIKEAENIFRRYDVPYHWHPFPSRYSTATSRSHKKKGKKNTSRHPLSR